MHPENKNAPALSCMGRFKAEREGFEPSMTETAIPVFETGSFSRSDTSPGGGGVGKSPAQRQNGYHSEAKPTCQSAPRGVWNGG